MILDKTIKRFKNLNLEVSSLGGTRWKVKNPANGNELVFWENGTGSNYVGYFIAKHPDTDASVDLFMDSYYETIKGAINYLCPLTPK